MADAVVEHSADADLFDGDADRLIMADQTEDH